MANFMNSFSTLEAGSKRVNLAGLCVAIITLYYILRTVYRLFLHPLRKIPGPRFAAASYLGEFYYDVVKGGKYIFEIERMHEKYGAGSLSRRLNVQGH